MLRLIERAFDRRDRLCRPSPGGAERCEELGGVLHRSHHLTGTKGLSGWWFQLTKHMRTCGPVGHPLAKYMSQWVQTSRVKVEYNNL